MKFVCIVLLILTAKAFAQHDVEENDYAKCRAYNESLRALSKSYVGETKRDCRYDRDCVEKFTLGWCAPEAMNRSSAHKWTFFFQSTAYRELQAQRPFCPIPMCAPPPPMKVVCQQNKCVRVMESERL